MWKTNCGNKIKNSAFHFYVEKFFSFPQRYLQPKPVLFLAFSCFSTFSTALLRILSISFLFFIKRRKNNCLRGICYVEIFL